MHWQKLSLLILLFSMNAFAAVSAHFRTPMRIYAGAVTVKVQFKKEFTEYDVPLWIKPDEADSSLDPTLMKELGYADQGFVFDTVKIAGQPIDKKRFRTQKAEWAYVPDFAKSCCFGVIGRDILKNFEIVVDPKAPPHIEWTRVLLPGKPSYSPQFLEDLKQLFSLTGRVKPHRLSLKDQKLEFVGTAPQSRGPQLFSFSFLPPDRYVRVGAIHENYAARFKKAGVGTGAVVVKLNDESVSSLDRWQVEQILRGVNSERVKLELNNKKTLVIDFK